MIPNNAQKVRRILTWLGGGAGLVLLMLYMGGFFTLDRIGPENQVRGLEQESDPEYTAVASVESITEYYEAVGTVRPRREARIEAQVTARILEMRVRPGDRVLKGDVLVVLDSRESQSRLEQAMKGLLTANARRSQAEQAVSAARAAFDQAASAYRRIQTFHASEAATTQDLERAESSFRQAEAGLNQAVSGLEEAEVGIKQAEKTVEQGRIAVAHTRILAPEDGEVAKRLAEPGELAWPGKPLVVLQTRGALRLEALVREGLIGRVAPGTRFQIVLSARNTILEGKVEEVEPSADPMTRTFLVKVALPDDPELFPGMFGRLRVPVDTHSVVLVPKRAVSHIGQLEVVRIEEKGTWRRIFVKTGREIQGKVEILSGLQGGERVALKGGRDA